MTRERASAPSADGVPASDLVTHVTVRTIPSLILLYSTPALFGRLHGHTAAFGP